jgi:drug/metabolite transporter (DMT)-like permease
MYLIRMVVYMTKFKGEMGLLLVSVVWGSGFIATAIGLDYLTTYETLAGRFLVASLLLGAINYKKIRLIGGQTIRKGMILGTFLFTAFVLQTVGLEYTTPSKNAFLTAICVAVVPFIGYFFHKRALVRMDVIRAAVAMAGVGLISFQWSGAVNIGDFLSFLCAFAFALHIFYTGEFTGNEDSVSLTMVQMMTAFVLSMTTMTLRGDSLLGQDPRGYMAIIYLGIFSTTICFLVMTISQKYTKPSRAAVIMSTESLFAMVFSILILSEAVTPRMILGAAVIFIAIILPQKEEETIGAAILEKDAI